MSDGDVLHGAEVVRYHADGKRNRYRLKHPGEVRTILSALSRFVKTASAVQRQNVDIVSHISGIPETWKFVRTRFTIFSSLDETAHSEFREARGMAVAPIAGAK